jgi:hypothetical protein
MPWIDAEEILDHWGDEPPIGVVIRHWLNVKPREAEPTTPEMTPEEFERLKSSFKANAAHFGRRR